MALQKLTTRQAETAGDGKHSAGGGLRLEVADKGKRRSWVFRFTSPVTHKVREMGLGRAAGASGDDGVTLKQARDERDRLRTLIKGGVDPLEARKEVAEAQRRKALVEAGKKTLREVAEEYIDWKKREWGTSSINIWRRFAERDIEPIAACAVADIGLAEIKRAVVPLVDADLVDTARLTQMRLQKLLEYAGEHGWRPEDKRSRFSQIAPKPKKGDLANHHPALLPKDDADAIRAAILKLRASPTMSAMALEFIILTAVRVSEGAEAEWSEISFDEALWTIPAARMKMGRAHRVPLSDRVLELLKGLYEHRGKNRHVFAGARPGQAVARTTVYDQSERVTGGKASPHGWRATFRSWCSKTGVNFEAAELALAHAKGAIVGAYDRDDMIERRRVIMQDWANWLSGPASAEVIPLAGRRA